MLPPQTLVPLDGKNLTLVQAFETGGSRAVKAALSERLGVKATTCIEAVDKSHR